MNSRGGFQIRWAWVPAAVFVVALSLHRRGVWITALLVLAGLGLGYYLNWRAMRRRGRGDPD